MTRTRLLFAAAIVAALVASVALLSGPTSADTSVEASQDPKTLTKLLSDTEPRITTTTTTTQPPTTTTTTTIPPTTTTQPPAPITTQPPTPVVAASSSGSCAGWGDLIAAHFPASQVSKACAVMLCESGGNPNAVSPTNDHGLFQINATYNRADFERVTGQPWSMVYDPGTNVRYAAWLFGQRGWQPWYCA